MTCTRPECEEEIDPRAAGSLVVTVGSGATFGFCCEQCLDWALHYDPRFMVNSATELGGIWVPPAQHAAKLRAQQAMALRAQAAALESPAMDERTG